MIKLQHAKRVWVVCIMLCLCGALFAQSTTVTGRISNKQTGEPLPDVTVNVKGTSVSTTSNNVGVYNISVPSANSVLVFSSMGFATFEITVRNTARLDVELEATNAALDEVVVIGYGAVKRRDLTGSVFSVKSDVIVQAPTFNAIEAIQGRVPGVDITRNSGVAGANSSITVRGNRSISGSNSPLFIIDGFMGASANDLNPNDIETIDVLKDASATAIYGSQGANGVIIITTKKGKSGKAKVSYDGYFGINGFTEYPKGRFGEDYVNLRREAFRTVGEWSSPADDFRLFPDPGEYDAYLNNQWIDWIDIIARNGTQQSHTVSVRGGNENTKVFFSGGLFREEGLLRGNDMTRYNFRLNLDQKINNWAKAGILSQVTYYNTNNRADPFSFANSYSPFGEAFDENGNINLFPLPNNTNRYSPLADERGPNIAADNQIRGVINTNAFLEINPIRGLTLRTNFGSVLDYSRRGIYFDAASLSQNNTRISNTSVSNTFNRFYNFDNIINYNTNFGDHSITVTGITNYMDRHVDNTGAQGQNQLLASQLFYNLGATEAASRSINSGLVVTNSMSYAARVNYGYKGKYLLTLSQRYDGASRLAPGNKWDAFPSAAVAWNISDEDFLVDSKTINQLKLRVSYGVTGNSGISPYGTQSLVNPSTRISFGEVPGLMFLIDRTVGNPNLGWEKSYTTNIGLDFSILKNRISGSIDAYNTNTRDILLLRALPVSSGVMNTFQNIGATNNKGIEIAINSVNVKRTNFEWNSTLTFTRNAEKITSLIDGNNIIQNERTSLLLGRPINSFYTFQKLGIWQLDEAAKAAELRSGTYTFQPGDIKLADLNGDGIIDANNDRTYVGSTVPDWFAGFQNTITFKNFDLGVYAFARMGQTIDAEFLGRYNPSGNGNGPAMLDYWTPENPTNDFPRPRKDATITSYAGYTGYQAINFVDGSFFKIKNLTLGYTLPQLVVERLRIERLRVYMTGSNMFTWARSPLIRNYDPERGGSESSPLNRQFVFGVNVTF